MLAVVLCSLLALSKVSAADIPTSPYCTGECAQDFSLGYQFESASWVAKNLSDDPFWSIPDNSNATAAGDIIKWENVTPESSPTLSNWSLPGGTILARFLYLSEDVDGALLPASAFALLPFKPPYGQKKLRTLVWSHGTAGISPICAPSNHNNLFYDWSAPYSYAQAGYAVIAPDYKGLGTNIPKGFRYLAGYSHAADAVFSLIAARKQLGGILTEEWVTVGQSEGGMTAWRTNERLAMKGQEALQKAGPFLGSVAIAPALRPLDMIHDWNASGDIANSAVIAWLLLQSVERLYPNQFQQKDWLTPTALARSDLALEACWYTGYYLSRGLNVTEMYTNTSWTQHPVFADWRRTYMKEGNFPLAAPMLIVQGSADLLVPLNYTLEDYKRTCSKYPSSSIQLNVYHGQDHDVVTTSAQPDYLKWISDRFDQIPAQKNCSRTDFDPLFSWFNTIPRVYNNNVIV